MELKINTWARENLEREYTQVLSENRDIRTQRDILNKKIKIQRNKINTLEKMVIEMGEDYTKAETDLDKAVMFTKALKVMTDGLGSFDQNARNTSIKIDEFLNQLNKDK